MYNNISNTNNMRVRILPSKFEKTRFMNITYLHKNEIFRFCFSNEQCVEIIIRKYYRNIFCHICFQHVLMSIYHCVYISYKTIKSIIDYFSLILRQNKI